MRCVNVPKFVLGGFVFLVMFGVTACGGPRHSSFATSVSQYQTMMALCDDSEKEKCQKSYEYIYGVADNEHRINEYHKIMSECSESDKRICQNRYDNMVVF